ncbi:MAG: hypothetical protein RIQ56_42 [Candidatus Parcubacteria bacterium]|jgi:hypothetical protein
MNLRTYADTFAKNQQKIAATLAMPLVAYFDSEELEGIENKKDSQELSRILSRLGHITVGNLAFAYIADTGIDTVNYNSEEVDYAFKALKKIGRRDGNILQHIADFLDYYCNQIGLNE